ncbi:MULTISPECIES: GNAT family N-acetyltransferase [Bacillota]|jgi:ribosomal protein S18 acetylase RimI-like enzyme|uniref:GNAT family N-acetyltransferase n=1 Tax=Irregularibacter muris TaxID=1796619 RepID=A0AAE3HEU5_9FIRM|nr:MULTISPECIES: GNAT family N-acetyltransferase [Bacillota]MCR1899230.1 GNAT family N-acetyltransferase [Irregularibacter muris]WIV12875.1 GNAT family N-acetyltransferase [Proteiniborus sp. MB09-C3]
MEELVLSKIKKHMINDCVDLYIETFTKEPWNDIYESRKQVVEFFNNHFNNNYFVGYAALLDDKVVALSIGMKKPWIEGFEYYIDEFCVSYEMQGRAIGSWFIKAIEEDIKEQGMNAMILNTEKNYPSQKFYEKNGFKTLSDLIILVK